METVDGKAVANEPTNNRRTKFVCSSITYELVLFYFYFIFKPIYFVCFFMFFYVLLFHFQSCKHKLIGFSFTYLCS